MNLTEQLTEAKPETALKACLIFMTTMHNLKKNSKGTTEGQTILVFELQGNDYTITIENGDQS